MKSVNSLRYFLVGLWLVLGVSCSKDEGNNGGNNNQPDPQVIELTERFIIPSDNHIMPLADNHRSDILKVFYAGGKEFHYYHVLTSAQHQYHLARFENDTWVNYVSSPNYMHFVASDQAICQVEHTSPNSQVDVIKTRFFDPNAETFSLYTEQTFQIKFWSVQLAATQSDFYLIGKRQDDGVAMLYKWNPGTQVWDLIIGSIPNGEEWSPVQQDVFRSKNDEFIYKNTNNTGVNFYEFKDNQFTRIYRGGYDEIILMRGARLHVINNDYLVAFDKLYRVGAGNTLSEYYAPEASWSILHSNVSGKWIIMSLGTYSWNGTTSVQKIVVINYLNGKTYELPALVIFLGWDAWNLTNKYDVDKWHFRMNSENKLEGLIHFEYNGPVGQAKLYRVVYPVAFE